MTATHQGHDVLQHGGRAHLFRRQRPALDEATNQRARFAVDQRRSDPRRCRRARRRRLVEAQDAMYGDVLADAHEVALATVPYQKVGVGDAACDRLRLDWTGPVRERRGPGLG